LASRLGYAAVNALIEGRTQVMVGIMNDKVTYTPFCNVIKGETPINPDMLEMIRVLAV
jgi:6-phosphofructokinase 1